MELKNKQIWLCNIRLIAIFEERVPITIYNSKSEEFYVYCYVIAIVAIGREGGGHKIKD